MSVTIFDVLKNLYENWNDKNFTGCIFIDFSRAFDTIDHQILAEKLGSYGLTLFPRNSCLNIFLVENIIPPLTDANPQTPLLLMVQPKGPFSALLSLSFMLTIFSLP